ncbi:hypothetical protein [Sphingomonas leidyi]|uniref:hypothetical protein n=1 Tax=Sphingomonas leidyi TaxID=68569 RepID=UPI001593F7EE
MDTPQKLTNAALAVSFMVSSPAVARDADLWAFVDTADRSDRAGAPPASMQQSLQASLTPGERNSLRTTRLRVHETSIGPFDLSLSAMRLKGGSTEPAQFARGNRFGARAAALGLSLDIGSDLDLRSELLLARMKHHLTTPALGYHARSTNFGSLGFGVARRDGPALMFAYLLAGAPGRRAPLERMEEVAEGAPRTGHGLRLTYSATPDPTARGETQWGLTLSAWHRPSAEFGLPGFRSAADNRAELFFRMPL